MSAATQLLGLLQYEFRRKFSKRKFVEAIVLLLLVPTFLILGIRSSGSSVSAPSNYSWTVVKLVLGIMGNRSIPVLLAPLLFIVLCILVSVDSIPAEFASKTIINVLSKPVNRALVFASRLLVAFCVIVIFAAIVVVFPTILATFLVGRQPGVLALGFPLVGSIVYLLFWISLTFFLSSVLMRSSLTSGLLIIGTLVAAVGFIYLAIKDANTLQIDQLLYPLIFNQAGYWGEAVSSYPGAGVAFTNQGNFLTSPQSGSILRSPLSDIFFRPPTVLPTVPAVVAFQDAVFELLALSALLFLLSYFFFKRKEVT